MAAKTVVAVPKATDRYRVAEARLWNQWGLEPTERYIDLQSPPIRLRVVEVGTGPPVLFIPGTGGTGPYWAPLVRALNGYRCLMVDRPGWGLSDPIDYSKYRYSSVVVDLLAGVIDALELRTAHVVGASIGYIWALRLAQRYPAGIEKIVLLGGGPNPEIPMSTFLKLLASPIGNLMVRVPVKPKMMQSQLRALGHGSSLDQGRMGDFIDWRLTFMNETHSMRHERDMVRALLDRGALRPGLAFEDHELHEIKAPTLMIFGTADPSGDTGIWQRFVDQLPQGELKILDGFGHMPWWDDPAAVGQEVASFLKGV
jgi:2-hydroxy-6-oxonona-2,4-dienedioate hydrolase